MGLWDKIKGKANDALNQAKPSAEEADDEDRDEEEMEASSDDDEMEASSDDDEDDTEVDDWNGWDPNDWQGFWAKVFEIEAAGNQGDAQLAQVFAKYGLRDNHHFMRVRDTFNRRFGHEQAFMQAAFNARTQQGKDMLKSAATGALFEPIEGVDLKTYATIQARMAQVAGGGVAAIGKMLAEYQLDDAKWRRVDGAWQKRMQQQDDPNASYALMAEYGQHFAAAGQGQFGGAAAAAAGGVGIHGSVGQAPGGAEPCTFERYIEIMTAQGCWAEDGKDVNALLKQVFNMNAADWGSLGAYWSQKIAADYTLALKIDELQNHYKPKYSGGGADDDLTV
jgi:hypothetical protein